MSASEKLKTLERTLYRPLPHPHEGERQLMAALPQIVAVVQSAEREVGMEEDTEEARARQMPRLRAALAALEDALA